MARQLVQVVTDSTADLPVEVARAAGVKVVPLTVRFGSKVFHDGIDLSVDEFYRMLKRNPSLPTTSAPSPGSFMDVYRAAVEEDRKVVSIHLSGSISGTYNSAQLAAAEFPGDRITVVDSRNGSMALGWIALMVAEAAQQGATIPELRALADDLIPRAHLYAILDTLDNLRRGGRIGRAAAFLGTLLSVKPILTIAGGEVTPVEKTRLLSRALRRLVDIAQDHAPIERMAVAHTDAPETVELLREMIEEAIPGLQTMVYRAGSVVGTLAGPGAVALVFVSGRRK